MRLCFRIVMCLYSLYQPLAPSLIPPPFTSFGSLFRSIGMFVSFSIGDYPARIHHFLTSSPPSPSEIRPFDSSVQTILHIITTLKPSSPTPHLILILWLNSSWQKLTITANGPALLQTLTRKNITSVQTQALRHPRMTHELRRPKIPLNLLIHL